MTNWKQAKLLYSLCSAFCIALVILLASLPASDEGVWSSVFIILFLAATVVSFIVVHRLFRQLGQESKKAQQLQTQVEQSTEAILTLRSQVHYISDISDSFSEMNEALIGSYSMTGIIKSSLERLEHSERYRMMMFSQFDGEFIHVRDKSGDQYHLINAPEYPIAALESEPLFGSTLHAIESLHWQIDTEFNLSDKIPVRKRADDYHLFASIALPLTDNIFDAEFSILTLWTEREEGFSNEEISELDQVAKELAKALSAFKQRQMRDYLDAEQPRHYSDVLLSYVDIIEKQDVYIAGHTLRVAEYAKLMAKHLGLNKSEIHTLERAAILHDVGKIATPDTILLKPGRLSMLEYERIKQHVLTSYRMLSKVDEFSEVADIVKLHHEHYDGSGYPYGLAGDDIPLTAHILILADAYDAMTAQSLYKERISHEEALRELQRLSGSQFHPEVVDAALCVLSSQYLKSADFQIPKDLNQKRRSYF